MFDFLTTFAQGTPVDPSGYYFTQGVLGVTVVVLGIALIYIYKTLSAKLDKKEDEKIAILEAWRQETKDEGKAALDVLKGNSQSIFYLADKLKTGRNDNTTHRSQQ